jgi:hypothetical protein
MKINTAVLLILLSCTALYGQDHAVTSDDIHVFLEQFDKKTRYWIFDAVGKQPEHERYISMRQVYWTSWKVADKISDTISAAIFQKLSRTLDEFKTDKIMKVDAMEQVLDLNCGAQVRFSELNTLISELVSVTREEIEKLWSGDIKSEDAVTVLLAEDFYEGEFQKRKAAILDFYNGIIK